MEQTRQRADKLLVALGYFESRASARAAIKAGGVRADGVEVSKPSQMLNRTAAITAQPAHPYVSRGGLKLAHALRVFEINPRGLECLDIGASTGGFTDVLLQAGAARVTCLDVGQGQLHHSLRANASVCVFEGLDARDAGPEHINQTTSLLVTDLSFIALEKALGPILDQARVGTDFIGLFKPQFQVGRKHVGRGGIVTDAAATDAAASAFEVWMNENGWPILQWTASPVLGGDGNAERLFHARKI